MRKITLFIFLSFLFAKYTTAQESGTDLAIGEWKQHLPFISGIYVTQSDDQVFYATAYGLLFVEKEDRTRRQVT